MPSLLRSSLALAVLGALSSRLAADDPKASPPPEHAELRVISPPGDGAAPIVRVERHRIGRVADGEKETVTYLGLEASPVPAVLTAQLGLSPGTGLVVGRLIPQSPAAAVLQTNDVLLKLDDQQLIDEHQLAVLVRQHKEGDQVTLTYLRAGKQATVTVKLAKHEVPKLSLQLGEGPSAFGAGNMAFPFDHAGAPRALGDRAAVDRVLSLVRRSDGGPETLAGGVMPAPRIEFEHQPGSISAMSVNPANSTLDYSDDDGSLELQIKEGKKSLVAKSAKGEALFSGPVDTEAERKALPPAIRTRLEKLEGMHNVTFGTDGDFEGAESRLLRPLARGIYFARPPAAPPPPNLSY